MRGVGGEINCGEAAGEEDLAVVFEAILFAGKDHAGGEESGAAEIHQSDFADRTHETPVMLVGVVAEKNHGGQDHDNADAHEPIGAEAHFEGFGFSFGDEWRWGEIGGRQTGGLRYGRRGRLRYEMRFGYRSGWNDRWN